MSTAFDIGDLITLTHTFTANEVPDDPTGVNFSRKLPDGEVEVFVYGVDDEVVRTGAGVYEIDVTVDMGGVHRWRWEGTGGLVTASEGTFIARYSHF